MTSAITAARPCPDMLAYLLTRRSCSVKTLAAPGPSTQDINTILSAAARVPDHGKLFPWYFITLQGENRRHAGALLRQAWLAENPDAEPAKLDLEAERFLRAPLVIAVIARMRQGKHPLWEQMLSAGAACQNLCLAANALGYGTNWLTEWYSYSPTFRAALGLDDDDHIAGFIYIGSVTQMPEERDRPDLGKITTDWTPGAALNKGDEYSQITLGYPRSGLNINRIETSTRRA